MMSFSLGRRGWCPIHYLAFFFLILASGFSAVAAQNSSKTSVGFSSVGNTAAINESPTITPTLALYFDPLQGESDADLVRRALLFNGELAAVRLDIERARARLRQAGVRPNPSVDFEQMTGRLTGSAGERETSIGVSLPVEVAGQRQRRINVAQAELEATEAQVAERERQLAGEVLAAYAEALAAMRELEITEGLNDIDLRTTRFLQARVNEGETAPIELSLLQVEVDRLARAPGKRKTDKDACCHWMWPKPFAT